MRRLSPVHAGMSYARLEAEGGLQWPCYDESHPGELLHSRLWEDPVPGTRAPFVPVDHDPPVDRLDADFPIRLTTGRRLESYNTGVQSAGYRSPLRRGETIDPRRRTPRACESSAASACGWSRGGARWRRRCASTRPCVPAWRS